jgi:TolB-like protein
VGIRFSNFEIDTGQGELRQDGQAVPIEPQVFDLLVHLVRHRDRIVSKDELLDTIWQGRIVSEAALSSRINAARRAIGDDGAKQNFIKTLHKRGFRFVADVTEADAPTAERAPSVVPLQSEPGAIPAPADPVHASSARLSIAVLPFDNLSGDPEHDYFGYGMTEDLIRLLARNRWLTVISRHSTAGFKGAGQDIRQIGEVLGVRYILVGSVRKTSELIRITAELVRAADGTQLWAETYDLPLEDIFDIQEEMARQIAATIEPELARVEQQLAARKPPDSFDAWDCFQRGLWHLWGFTSPGFESAKELFRRAIEIDPAFARAHGALGYVHIQQALYDEPEDRPARLATALEMARTSLELDERDCFCHCALGRALSLLQQNDEAFAAIEQAIELNPSFAQAFFAQGFNVLWGGRAIEAESLLDRATMLSPRDLHLWSFHHVRAWAHFSLGEFPQAADYARRATRQPNVTYRAFATLAASLANGGETAESETVAGELLRRKSTYTRETARHELFFCKDANFLEHFDKGLKAAGIPAA